MYLPLVNISDERTNKINTHTPQSQEGVPASWAQKIRIAMFDHFEIIFAFTVLIMQPFPQQRILWLFFQTMRSCCQQRVKETWKMTVLQDLLSQDAFTVGLNWSAHVSLNKEMSTRGSLSCVIWNHMMSGWCMLVDTMCALFPPLAPALLHE